MSTPNADGKSRASTSKHRIEMYLSDAEYREFERSRKLLGLTKSAYCRSQNGFDPDVKPGAGKGNQNARKRRRAKPETSR